MQMKKIIDSEVVELGGRKVKVMLVESIYGNPEDNKTIRRPYAKYVDKSINLSGIIHFNNDGEYLCNAKVDSSLIKISNDIDKVNCKNCLRKLGKKVEAPKINIETNIKNTTIQKNKHTKIFTLEAEQSLRRLLDKTKL